MSKLFEKRLNRLESTGALQFLKGGLKGLEKESLRVTAGGTISQTRHPENWGAPLTHPHITTDYSEALPELITPAFPQTTETIRFLDDIHRFIYTELPEEEMLWAASMPCAVSDDNVIPVAQYGKSNSGQVKHIYRLGLDYRYGRRMQAIAGVHFNYSLPEIFWPAYMDAEQQSEGLQCFINRCYFDLIRNFKRLGWIVPFLFGNSPAVCKTFLGGRTTRYQEMLPGTYYMPYATSLRMSDIGYKNKNQSDLAISYDSLDAYTESLESALRTPYPEYEAIGLKDRGKRVQLSTSILQIENEYYSFIRPKRNGHPGERPTSALRNRGIEYVEIRALDVNCFQQNGVDLSQLLFLEAFLIFCLLEDSPTLTKDELQEIEYNELTVALRGRTPKLSLQRCGEKSPLESWSLEICEQMRKICESLDSCEKDSPYVKSLDEQIEMIENKDALPSARILRTLSEKKIQYHTYVMELSEKYAANFRKTPPAEHTRDKFARLATTSHEEQLRLETEDSVGIDEYINNYLAPR